MINKSLEKQIVIDQDARHLVVMTDSSESSLRFSVRDGARLDLEVVIVGDPAGEIDLTMPVILESEGSQAHVHVLGLAQSSRIRIEASMQIASGAQQTDGQLSMRGLLLDDQASIAMTPGLDVAANDVSAGHGASIDRVDPRQRFYLESRGLSSSDAQRMIWRGMLTDMIQRYDPELASDEGWLHEITQHIV